MANVNTVILVGNLTRDPEIRTTTGGTSVASFGLAVNTSYGTGERAETETLFIDIVAFGSQADPIGRYLKKGRPVLVEGRLRLERWTGNDGAEHSKVGVVAHRVQFLGEAPRATSTATQGAAG
jgi:single-strand DNA-binding protein